MSRLATDKIWRKRLEEINPEFEAIQLPDKEQISDEIDQDSEWCEVVVDGEKRRIRFHDYDEVFSVPGLYEALFYEALECCSPSCVVTLLEDVIRDFNENPEELRVLDVGAGNGMVGDELHHRNVENVTGVDIIPEAKQATERDRPEVYDDYHVTDLTDLPEQVEENLRDKRFNCMVTVAALGFGDIPPEAFLKAVDLIETPGWLAFNIKEDFLNEKDSSGFQQLIRKLMREEYIQPQCYRRYQHRLSVEGEGLHYVAFVAKKLKDIPSEFLST